MLMELSNVAVANVSAHKGLSVDEALIMGETLYKQKGRMMEACSGIFVIVVIRFENARPCKNRAQYRRLIEKTTSVT